METKHRIIIGDSRRMIELNDESVHLVITSPPYWQLKDYGNHQQIGFNNSYEDYVNNLSLVWYECYRVLNKGCRMCINIGDQFARSVYYGRYKVIPIRTEIIKFCETIGFDYMGAIIWQKVTTTNTTGGATVMGSFPYPRNGILKIDYEFILIFKKQGKTHQVDKAIKEKSKMTTKEWNEYFSGHWNFAGERQQKHLAMFPEELPKRLIRMFSFVGDTVLDPFLGSGTTTVAAKNQNRNSVGYEINDEFLQIIKDKIKFNEPSFLTTFEIIKQEKSEIQFQKKITELPYQFRDPIQINKKIDPKKLNFGSRIDTNSKSREKYFTVKEIISANELKLSSDLKIKLLGVKIIPEREKRAVEFLRKKTKGQKVYIKFDQLKYDKSDTLLCYLYLANKTFINAHLIKNNLADVDTSIDFKYKAKFLSRGNRSYGERMDSQPSNESLGFK